MPASIGLHTSSSIFLSKVMQYFGELASHQEQLRSWKRPAVISDNNNQKKAPVDLVNWGFEVNAWQ